MFDRYSDASKFITEPGDRALDGDGFVYISGEDDYDIAVDFERCYCSFEEAKPLIALAVERINELDNIVQRFYNKSHGFSPLRETDFYLNLISFPKPDFVTLEYVCEKVNSQFDVVFEYKAGRFLLREFGLERDIPEDWDKGGKDKSTFEFGEKSMKKVNLIWALSLIIIGVCSVILAGSSILGIELPDFATRTIGIIDLIALPILAFTTVKKTKNGFRNKG